MLAPLPPPCRTRYLDNYPRPSRLPGAHLPLHPPPLLSLPRRPHGPTLLTPLGHAPAASAAALGPESPRGSRAEQLPEPRPRRRWGPRWPRRVRGTGGGGGGRRRRGELQVVGGWGMYFGDSTFPCLCPYISSPLTQLFPLLLLVSAFPPAAGSPGVSVVLCGSVIQDLSAGTCPITTRSVWLAVLRVSGPLHQGLSVPSSLGLVSWSLVFVWRGGVCFHSNRLR